MECNFSFKFLSDRVVKDALRSVSNSVAMQDWKMLARGFSEQSISEADILAIEHKYDRDLKEQCYQALCLWQSEATGTLKPKEVLVVLRRTLVQRGFREVAGLSQLTVHVVFISSLISGVVFFKSGRTGNIDRFFFRANC